MWIDEDLRQKAEEATAEAVKIGGCDRVPSRLARILSRWPVAVVVVGLLASAACTVAVIWLATRLIFRPGHIHIIEDWCASSGYGEAKRPRITPASPARGQNHSGM